VPGFAVIVRFRSCKTREGSQTADDLMWGELVRYLLK